MLAVVVKARRKHSLETIHSKSEKEYEPHETHTINSEIGIDSIQNYEEGRPTETSRHNEDIYGYATAEGTSPTQHVLSIPSLLMCLPTTVRCTWLITVRWLKDL